MKKKKVVEKKLSGNVVESTKGHEQEEGSAGNVNKDHGQEKDLQLKWPTTIDNKTIQERK